MLQKSSNVCATDFKNSPKWPNFAKSGNTGLKFGFILIAVNETFVIEAFAS